MGRGTVLAVCLVNHDRLFGATKIPFGGPPTGDTQNPREIISIKMDCFVILYIFQNIFSQKSKRYFLKILFLSFQKSKREDILKIYYLLGFLIYRDIAIFRTIQFKWIDSQVRYE